MSSTVSQIVQDRPVQIMRIPPCVGDGVAEPPNASGPSGDGKTAREEIDGDPPHPARARATIQLART